MKVSKAKKVETLHKILEESMKVFLSKSYERVKLSEISKACGIAEGTLYNYFKDKPTLFLATFMAFRNDQTDLYKVQRPKTYEAFLDEIIKVLDHYMRIENAHFEKVFKQFVHLSRDQKLNGSNAMGDALAEADAYLLDGIKSLLEFVEIGGNTSDMGAQAYTKENILEVIFMQAEGIYNDYLYGSLTFDMFLEKVRAHLKIILRELVVIPTLK